MKQWELTFSHGLGGKAERRMDILSREIRKCTEDLFLRHSVRYHADDGRNWNAQPANTGHAVHLLWIDRDSAHDCGTEKDGGTAPIRGFQYTPVAS